MRAVNTDDAPLDVAVVGVPYRVLAVDGRDLVGPNPVTGASVQIPAGGRADLGFDTPTDGSAVRVQLGTEGDTALLVGPVVPRLPSADPAGTTWTSFLRLPRAMGFDPDDTDRRFDYSIGRRPGSSTASQGCTGRSTDTYFPTSPCSS